LDEVAKFTRFEMLPGSDFEIIGIRHPVELCLRASVKTDQVVV
jgi:hypothetical protein